MRGVLPMARAKKAKTVEVAIKKNMAIFTPEEASSYRKTLIQEIEWKAKGTLTIQEIEEMADGVINKDEQTTLWLRKKGMLFVSSFLLNERLIAVEGNVA